MKTVYKVLTTGTMMAALILGAAASGFAQDDPEKTALYEKFLACYKATDKPTRDACYTQTAKQYLDKYGSANDEYAKFVQGRYTRYQETVKREAFDELTKRFNDAIKNPQTVNADAAFEAGRQIIAQSPDLAVDVPIVLATIGFDNAALKTPNDKYNGDAINYAKMALQQMEAGKPSVTKSYGAFAYSYNNKDNATGWMNYAIGYIMFNRMNQKKEALPFFYKATQINSDTKTNPAVYQAIGSWYLDEFLKIDADRLKKAEAAGNVETDETKAMLALQKGYAERAAEAYARAYKVAKTDAANQAYRDSLLKRARELYEIRYNKDMSGFDAFLAGVMTKPFTDPTTAVNPVVETTPATTGSTTPTGASTMTSGANDSTGGAAARPASTGAAAATTKTNGNGAAAKPAAPKSTAKKPRR